MRLALFFIFLFSVFTVSFCGCSTFMASNGTLYDLDYLTRTPGQGDDYTVVGDYKGDVMQYVFNFCQFVTSVNALAIQVDVGASPPYGVNGAFLVNSGFWIKPTTELADGRISVLYYAGDSTYGCTPRTFEIRISSLEDWPCGVYNVSFDASAADSCDYVVDFLTNLQCTQTPSSLYSPSSASQPSNSHFPYSIPISLPSEETFIIFMVLYGFFIISSILFFFLRRRQVAKMIRKHQKSKTGPTDLSSLDEKIRNRITSLSNSSEILWADVSHPVPSVAGLIFAIVLSIFGIVLVSITTQMSVIVFNSFFYIIFIVLVVPGFFYTFVMLIKLLKSYKYDAFNVLTDRSAIVQYQSVFKNVTKEWPFENIKRENIRVRDSFVISGVSSLEFAFQFKDVTHEYKNNPNAYRNNKPIIHLSNKVSLDTMVDMPITNDVSQNGKIYRRTAVGFMNIINAYDTEKIFSERVR